MLGKVFLGHFHQQTIGAVVHLRALLVEQAQPRQQQENLFRQRLFDTGRQRKPVLKSPVQFFR